MQNPSSSPSNETTRIEVNVSEFSRGEISVKLRRDKTLVIHGLHLDQFSKDNFFRKELVKTFSLPAGADVDKIRSVIKNTGILTIDIPMSRDKNLLKTPHEEILKHPNESIREINRSMSHGDMMKSNNQTTASKRTGSLGDTESRQYHQNSSKFNIANFLQSDFHPRFAPSGKKIILKVDTRGYEPDELSVRLLDNTLLVQGRKKFLLRSRKNENKQFSQSIRLPDGIDKYNVTSQVVDNGMLVIDIPLLNSVQYRA